MSTEETLLCVLVMNFATLPNVPLTRPSSTSLFLGIITFAPTAICSVSISSDFPPSTGAACNCICPVRGSLL
ncbi:hypothetical protein XENTR_v10018411 [Xenopus tropicalis]|nr:hypothetical protein XENTR_v10018411 [Xenopus tropicalis]